MGGGGRVPNPPLKVPTKIKVPHKLELRGYEVTPLRLEYCINKKTLEFPSFCPINLFQLDIFNDHLSNYKMRAFKKNVQNNIFEKQYNIFDQQ